MPRILVVDDQKDVRAMLCMVLRVNRFDVAEADSIKSGLRAFVASSARLPPLLSPSPSPASSSTRTSWSARPGCVHCSVPPTMGIGYLGQRRQRW